MQSQGDTRTPKQCATGLKIIGGRKIRRHETIMYLHNVDVVPPPTFLSIEFHSLFIFSITPFEESEFSSPKDVNYLGCSFPQISQF